MIPTCRYDQSAMVRATPEGEDFALLAFTERPGSDQRQVFSVTVWKCTRCSYIELHDGPEVPR